METTDNWFDKLLMRKRFYIIVTLLFVGVFAYIFKWQHILHFFDDEYVVNHELLGTYGDFIGGVLGTIFALISTLILIRTFNQQRAVTEKNKEQIEKYILENPDPSYQNIRFLYYDLPFWMRFWKKGNRGAMLYYVLWQYGIVNFIR